MLNETIDRGMRLLYRQDGIVPEPYEPDSADNIAKLTDDAYRAKIKENVDRRLRIRLRQSGIPIAGDNEELIAEDNKKENEYVAARKEKLLALKSKPKSKFISLSRLRLHNKE
ncbi:uncharacterized protein LOC126836938 [Adelges cooleyi]|uniref:uncharacterized protein LOC126836938 n=1 Tax=Adelges cooleyi TaxID=133065 RepID=UPI0021800E5C|nr:uncharacterized protein LOC126836938 [Adelges cooleyi]